MLPNIILCVLPIFALGIQNDQMRIPCPPGETGYIPYPDDCRRYVNCWRGRGVLTFCGPGTLFNPETSRCDHPDNVDCGQSNVNYQRRRDTSQLFVHSPQYHQRHPHHHKHYHHHHHNFNSGYGNGDNNERRRFTPPMVVGRQNGGEGRFGSRDPDQFSAASNHPVVPGLSPGHSHNWHARHDASYSGYQGSSNWDRHHHHSSWQPERESQKPHSLPEQDDRVPSGPSISLQPPPPENPPRTPASDFQPPPRQPGRPAIHQPTKKFIHTIGPQPRPSVNSGESPRLPSYPLPPVQIPTVVRPPKLPDSVYPTVVPPKNEDSIEEPYQQVPDSEVITQDFDLECEEDSPPEPLLAASTFTETPAHYSPYSIPSEPLQKLTPLEDDLTARFGIDFERCPQGFSGLMPHSDCTRFLSCANGRTFLMNCSPGTRFNPQKLICDYPEKVVCYNIDYAGSQNVPQSVPYTPSTGHAASPIVRPVVDNQPYKSITNADGNDMDFDIDVRFGLGSTSDETKTKKRCRPTGSSNINNKSLKPLFTPSTDLDDTDTEPSNLNPVYQPHPNNPDIKGYFLPPKSSNKNSEKGFKPQGSQDLPDESPYERGYPNKNSEKGLKPQGSQGIPGESPYERGYEIPKELPETRSWDIISSEPVIVNKPRTTKAPPTTTRKPTTAKPTVSHVFRPDLVISPRSNLNSTQSDPNKQVLRLRGGSTQYEGFLEIQIAFNVWGVVCDQRNQWSLKEAHLVCKNMGYSRGAERSWQGSSGKNARSMISASVIATNSVKCVGHEGNLLECYISTGGNCELERDAVWVKCIPNPISACQPGEVPYGGKCYSLVVPREDVNDQELVGFSQGEALSHCQTRGAKLVDFTSQEENDFISEWLYRKGGSVDKVMTSGVGSAVMGHSIWIWEGSAEAFKYTNWWPGWGGGKGITPVTKTGRALCVVLQRMFPCQEKGRGTNSGEEQLCDAQYYFWAAEDCGSSSSRLPYICERPYDKIGCVVGNGASYSGPANVTKKGNPCMHWDSSPIQDAIKRTLTDPTLRSQLSGHNKCRNLDESEVHPWCYTLSTSGIVKEICDLPKCGQGVEKSGKFIDGVCPEDNFSCLDNTCIPNTWICDGEKDCKSGEDELDCSENLQKFTKHKGSRLQGNVIRSIPGVNLYMCAKECLETNSTFQCRSFSYAIDTSECVLSESNIGLSGLLSSSDTDKKWNYYELTSMSIRCHEHFICDNGKCITRAQECNGYNDCGDGSDEKDCSWLDFGINLKLTGGKHDNEGTIEVKVKNEWGLICDDDFDLSDADVICRQLGYPLGALELKPPTGSTKSNLTNFMVDNLHCAGNESNIVECEHNGWGVHDCAANESAGVVCKMDSKAECGFNYWQCKNTQECIPLHFLCDNVADCSDKSDEDESQCESPIAVRLVGLSRSSKSEGRVEVRRFGVWGTVCDDDFGEKEATVVCNSLGLPGPVEVYKEAMFGAGDGIIWLDQVRCEGNESNVALCLHEGWGQTNCRHNEDVSIACAGATKKQQGEDFAIDNFLGEGHRGQLPATCGRISPQITLPHSLAFKPKVVSGYETIKGTYPWQASVRVKSSSGRSAHWCGAVVITEFHILTAAHCLTDYIKSHYLIRSGDFDTEVDEGTEQELEVDEVWMHPNFDQGGPRLNNDIAVVRVKSPGFKFSSWVLPACIPEEDLPHASNCSISGWGTSGNPGSGFARTLHAAWIPTLSNRECTRSNVYQDGDLSDGMMCAGQGGSDSCQGDSGGPLLCINDGSSYVHGITSWGHGCGRTNTPGVYTRVAHYRDWILKHIN